MRTSTLRLCSLLLAGGAAAYASDPERGWSWSDYRKAVISPRSLASNAAGAGLAQWQDAVPAWGQGMEGYGKRFGSRVAQHAISGTVQYSIAIARHEDLHYKQSGLTGTGARLKHAVVGTWWVPRTVGPGRTFAVSRFSADFAGPSISRAWHPEESRTVGRAVRGGLIGMGIDTGMTLLREFWPFKKFRP